MPGESGTTTDNLRADRLEHRPTACGLRRGASPKPVRQKLGKRGESMSRLDLVPRRRSDMKRKIGLLGTATQGEIADARGGPGKGSEQESRGRTFSLDDLRAYSKQHSQADDRSPQQA